MCKPRFIFFFKVPKMHSKEYCHLEYMTSDDIPTCLLSNSARISLRSMQFKISGLPSDIDMLILVFN